MSIYSQNVFLLLNEPDRTKKLNIYSLWLFFFWQVTGVVEVSFDYPKTYYVKYIINLQVAHFFIAMKWTWPN